MISDFPNRAHDINSLIGNIGGYVGLLMGVSVAQLPYFILQLRDTLKAIINRRKQNKVLFKCKTNV